MQNFNSFRVSTLTKVANLATLKVIRSIAKGFSISTNRIISAQKSQTSQQAIASDWKKIGKDMKFGVVKYDRKLTRQAVKDKR